MNKSTYSNAINDYNNTVDRYLNNPTQELQEAVERLFKFLLSFSRTN